MDDGALQFGAADAVPGLELPVARVLEDVDTRTDEGRRPGVGLARGTEHEVTVNGTDGKVTATKADRDNDSDDRSRDAALAKVKGTATSADLENDHGKTTTWHVDVTDTKGNDHEVTVDAANGKVTATKTDDDNDHGNDSGDHDED